MGSAEDGGSGNIIYGTTDEFFFYDNTAHLSAEEKNP